MFFLAIFCENRSNSENRVLDDVEEHRERAEFFCFGFFFFFLEARGAEIELLKDCNTLLQYNPSKQGINI